MELNGILFTKDKETYRVLDLTYGIPLGHIEKVEGPGWVLLLALGTTFLDYGQLTTLAEFIKGLQKDVEGNETLGPCGCVDYHMADCPTRTSVYDMEVKRF